MIKEINKPKLNNYLIAGETAKYYFDNVAKQYFFKQNKFDRIYFNLNGHWHRDDGPSIYPLDRNFIHYWLNDRGYCKVTFTKLTNHLLCKICQNFCKQNCF